MDEGLCAQGSRWLLKVKVTQSCPTFGLHSPWNSPGQNTGVGSLSLLQGIFPTWGLNTVLMPCRRILYQLSHNGRWLLDLEKNREMDSSLEPPGGTNLVDSLTLAQWDWFQGSECTMMRIDSCFFKPPFPSKEKTVRTVSSQGVSWI